jgi:outer membrane lipoprotein carrier protein
MKKLIILSSLIILVLSASAQYDPEAKTVLDAMSTKYKKIGAFSASFSQKIENKMASVDEEITGKITVKGNKYKLEVIENEIFNNGKEVWVYSPELKEVTVSTYSPEEEEITPGNVYDIYKKGFKYALISTLANGDRIIELDPVSRDKTYHKIRLNIDNQNSLNTFTVFEKSGNQYVYSVKDFKAISSLQDSFFTFDPAKYKGVEVIDFR